MSKANARFPLATLTAAVLCAALAACGGGGDSSPATQSTNTNTNNNATASATANQFATGLNKPVGIVRDAAGDFFIANKGTSSVLKIAAGSASPATASAFNTAATFADLRSIAVTQDGATVYVVDGQEVKFVHASGVPTTIIGEADLVNPQGIAVDANFNVFVADAGAGVIKKGDPNTGTVSTVATGLTGVTSLALDAAGTLYATLVGQNGATTIKKIANAATATNATAADVTGATGLTGITGIAVGSTGTIYAVGGTNITTVTAAGVKTTKSVGSGTAAAKTLSGVATAATGGDVYATDSTNNVVLKVTP